MTQEEQDRFLKAFSEYCIRESKDVTFIDYIPIVVLVVGLICSISIIFYL